MPNDVLDVHLHTPSSTRILCDLLTVTTQWTDDPKNVTVFQRVGEQPVLDINFFDGNRDMDESVLRVKALERAWELASIWHTQTRPRSVGTEPASLA